MTDKPSEDDKEAERRFNETLGRMLGSPPKPHKPVEKRREPPEVDPHENHGGAASGSASEPI